MRRSVPSLLLEPDAVAWHQMQSFVAGPRSFAERLASSPLFAGAPRRGWGAAEWVRLDEEDDPLAFPLGRVTVHPDGILLEAFSDERLDGLRRRARSLGAGDVPSDETRVFRLETALANPAALLQPLEERSGRGLDARDVASAWLRMAWPYLAREDLRGRAPFALAGTGKGRDALEALLGRLPAELAAIPGFPRLTPRNLRAILLPEAVAARPASPRKPAAGRGARRS